ncbi:TrmH family RNA methyltransferase [Thermincola ferriacetica]
MKETITSAKNMRIMYLQSLLQKKYRDREGKFLVEGLRFVQEALQSGADIEELILAAGVLEKNPSFQSIISDKIPITIIADQLFKKITDTETPQGIAALVRKKEFRAEDLFVVANPFLLIIDKVQDPGNLGTIIRTADAAGVTGVALVKGTADLYNPKTLRATMGSVFHVPIINFDSIEEACHLAKKHGLKLIVTDISKDSSSYLAVDYSEPVALVVGNEASGASSFAIENSDYRVVIKMPGKAESLNVSVATGIILFEAARQRACGQA